MSKNHVFFLLHSHHIIQVKARFQNNGLPLQSGRRPSLSTPKAGDAQGDQHIDFSSWSSWSVQLYLSKTRAPDTVPSLKLSLASFIFLHKASFDFLVQKQHFHHFDHKKV